MQELVYHTREKWHELADRDLTGLAVRGSEGRGASSPAAHGTRRPPRSPGAPPGHDRRAKQARDYPEITQSWQIHMICEDNYLFVEQR